jgi:predicted  nucleic acid-binding Zn-ribbon protein
MNAVAIQNQINMYVKKRDNYINDLNGYKKVLDRMNAAKADLEQKKERYENEFRVDSTSYPTKILAIDSLGLIGVEKMQDKIEDAYSGNKEKNFVTSVAAALYALHRKITSEEEKKKRCEINISNTNNTIESLKRQLQNCAV